MVVKYAYSGYEYQIDASVWCALHLVLERKYCELIQIEPASLEDIEAELLVDPEKADNISTISDRKLKLIIQIKSKSSGPWSMSDISKILFRNMDESDLNEKEKHFSRLSPDKSGRKSIPSQHFSHK